MKLKGNTSVLVSWREKLEDRKSKLLNLKMLYSKDHIDYCWDVPVRTKDTEKSDSWILHKIEVSLQTSISFQGGGITSRIW